MNTFQKIEDLLKELDSHRSPSNNGEYAVALYRAMYELRRLKKYY